MDSKAQGAIEYLLIIGAAILVVAIVIAAMSGIIQSGGEQNDGAVNDYNSSLNDLNALKRK